LQSGDYVLVKGTLQRETVLVVTPDTICSKGKAGANGCARENSGAILGESVRVCKVPSMSPGTKACFLLCSDIIDISTGDLVDNWLKPYFSQRPRPFKVGDACILRSASRAVEFKVISVEVAGGQPAQYCIVGTDTRIVCAQWDDT
jgi:transitional endoplasmic reticulum ATPase